MSNMYNIGCFSLLKKAMIHNALKLMSLNHLYQIIDHLVNHNESEALALRLKTFMNLSPVVNALT